MCEYLDEIWDEGKKEGIQLKLATQIIKKVRKHKTLKVIAEELECEIGEISELYEVIQACGSQCEAMEVLTKIKEEAKCC
ncbi:MAG: hypothetical protein R3Y24_12045 [Eubacteriales bacterium]